MTTANSSTRSKSEIATADQHDVEAIVKYLLTCPACNREMIRLNEDGSWGCPYVLDHTGVLQTGTFRYRISELIPFDQTPDRLVTPKNKSEEPYTKKGRDLQLTRLMKKLDKRCGWRKPVWMSYYKTYQQRRAPDSLCVLRVGKWFVAFGGYKEGPAWELHNLLRWETALSERTKETVRVTFSPFDHRGDIEQKLVEAGIEII